MNTTISDNIAIQLKWTIIPSARLKETKNTMTPELHSHQAVKSGHLGAGDNIPHESPSYTNDDTPIHLSLPLSWAKSTKGLTIPTSPLTQTSWT